MACATAELSLMLAMMRPPGLNRCPSCFHTSTYIVGNRLGNRVAHTYGYIGNTVHNSNGNTVFDTVGNRGVCTPAWRGVHPGMEGYAPQHGVIVHPGMEWLCTPA